MSCYDNVIVGKLKLKGKPLDVKSGAVTKKKKQKKCYDLSFNREHPSSGLMKEMNAMMMNEEDGGEGAPNYEERFTPAERRYLEQWKQLEAKRLLKNANESHRDRVHKFNQYLANLSEHYDIPKVGPG